MNAVGPSHNGINSTVQGFYTFGVLQYNLVCVLTPGGEELAFGDDHFEYLSPWPGRPVPVRSLKIKYLIKMRSINLNLISYMN